MANIVNILGERFGKLVVVRKAGLSKHSDRLWLCRCECGVEIEFTTHRLRKGSAKSCGRCGKARMRKDLTGQRFGKLVALRRVYDPEKRRSAWFCQCDCGGTVVYPTSYLLPEKGSSCGCASKKLPLGEASRRGVLGSCKRNAKTRGYCWELTDEQFFAITVQNCYYCGVPPSNTYQHIGMNGSFTYNGIDRLRNTEGYTVDNVVPCCKNCNRAKWEMSVDEFRDWLTRAYCHFVAGGVNRPAPPGG